MAEQSDLGVAVVTGGNRGIGLSTSLLLREQGWRTVVLCRSGQAPEGLDAIACDVTDGQSVELAFKTVESEYGPVAGLVSNAGITRDTLLLTMGEDAFTEVIDANLTGAYRVARRASRSMLRAKKGQMVFVSSVVGLLGSAGQANYAASKAGLVGLARSIARELGPRGITANVVAPGPIRTDMTAELSDEVIAAIVGKVPLGRMAEPEEVAATIAFLLSPQAAYISGAVVPVDGGLGMGH